MARLPKFLGSHNFQESLTLQRRAAVVKTITISIIIPGQFVEHFHGAAWPSPRRYQKLAIFQSGQSSVTGCLAIVLGQTEISRAEVRERATFSPKFDDGVLERP
jgi:hypothetical protein